MSKMTSRKLTVVFCAMVLMNVLIALGHCDGIEEISRGLDAKKKGSAEETYVSKSFFLLWNKPLLTGHNIPYLLSKPIHTDLSSMMYLNICCSFRKIKKIYNVIGFQLMKSVNLLVRLDDLEGCGFRQTVAEWSFCDCMLVERKFGSTLNWKHEMLPCPSISNQREWTMPTTINSLKSDTRTLLKVAAFKHFTLRRTPLFVRGQTGVKVIGGGGLKWKEKSNIFLPLTSFRYDL